MRHNSYCNREAPRRAIRGVLAGVAVLLGVFAEGPLFSARASDQAPPWMHAVANGPLPEHDDRTTAVLLYSEDILRVDANGKMKSTQRRVYKILRPDGRDYGTAVAEFDPDTKITSMHGWCIPAQGKDFAVGEKQAMESGLTDVENGILMTDQRVKILKIPAADVGNVVGYEIEQEDRPYILQDVWDFQSSIPVSQAHYTLQLPSGWEYKAIWINHAEVKAVPGADNTWQWTVDHVPGIRSEDDMPPWRGVVGQMVVTLLPPGGGTAKKGFETWSDMGRWQAELAQGKRDASPEIKQKVAELTANAGTPVEKMEAIANFLQQEIRYVGIELGIGGYQPHAAADVFSHRYGDCKDKATLMSSMLHEIGIDSYYIIINTERGAVSATTPPTLGWFNHAILAIKLPEGVDSPLLAATYREPKLGKLLIFDPTDQMTPFGKLRGDLQADYGLLVTPEGGELIELPQLPAETNGIHRSANLKLDDKGNLTGFVREVWYGDYGSRQRYVLRAATRDEDKIKPLEKTLGSSLSDFQITQASVVNLQEKQSAFEYRYAFSSANYAKRAGNLLLVRPRVMGERSSALLETKEPRKFPVEFDGPSKSVDAFDIHIPDGYEVDDVPPPVDVDYGFADYHSKTEVKGNTISYVRTFEVKQLSVPVAKMDELKKLYRTIASDERNNAVLKPSMTSATKATN